MFGAEGEEGWFFLFEFAWIAEELSGEGEFLEAFCELANGLFFWFCVHCRKLLTGERFFYGFWGFVWCFFSFGFVRIAEDFSGEGGYFCVWLEDFFLGYNGVGDCRKLIRICLIFGKTFGFVRIAEDFWGEGGCELGDSKCSLPSHAFQSEKHAQLHMQIQSLSLSSSLSLPL